jgi:hypothetical protein
VTDKARCGAGPHAVRICTTLAKSCDISVSGSSDFPHPDHSRHVPRSVVVAMSSGSFSRASLALRSSRGGAVWRSCGGTAALGLGRPSQRRWASNSNDNKPTADGERPFYLQLNESIYERVQKEKAEQIQIQSLQQRTARGRFFATVFGTPGSLPCPSTTAADDAAR